MLFKSAAVLLVCVCAFSVVSAVRWNADDKCFVKSPDGNAFDGVSVKDPSIVYYNGYWHVFYTAKDKCCFRMGYVTATTIAGLKTAKHTQMLSIKGGDWACAPQVFYFAAKHTWYLIYQNNGATFSTNTDVSNPNGWAPGKAMGFGDGIDFWVVSDGSNVYAFYSKQDQTILTRHTSVASFPYGWSGASVAVRDAFEAVHVYHSKADGKYYMMVENLYRWFELHVADSLAGPFRLIENHWADGGSISYNPGVGKWTDQVSHGEIIRSANNEFMEINDINRVDVLIQGVINGNWQYGDVPYQLGLIHNYASNTNPTPNDTPLPPAPDVGVLCGMTSSEGESVDLSCPKAQKISSVDFASYGTPTGDCGVGFKQSSCHSSTSVSVVQSKCVGQNACSLVGSNDVFGDPCPSTNKHFYVKVSCTTVNVTCASTSAEGDSAAVGCANGGVISTVDFASYGTPTGDCSSGFTQSSCHSNTSMSVVQKRCVGQASCTVPGNNDLFGDPCPTVAKHVALKVTCGPAPATTCAATANEGDSASLSCPSGQVIGTVNFASYGTPTGDCSSGFQQSSCHSSTSMSVVEKRCVGQASCTVPGNNDLFGDPCPNTAKHVAVKATCK